MTNPITHLIWDCDGCLIDSEVLACRVAAEFYTSAGYPITTEEYILRFAGKSKKEIRQILEEETGQSFEGKLDYVEKTRRRKAAFEAELKEVNGLTQALAAIKLPMAIASGSDMERLEHSLKIVNLWDKFAPHVYSSEMVAKGKPAPDVFLYAAEKLHAKPENCVVVEDGHHGVHGAKAAGMYVLGYIGATHGSPELAERLTAAGADRIFKHMSELPAIIKELSHA